MAVIYRFDDDRSLDTYLREIGKIPLLSTDEEKDLARRIKQGDKKAKEKLVKANLRFVVRVAKQYRNQGLDLMDLINEGNIGLINAAQRFDETLGFKFISYAVWLIRQAIMAALTEQIRIVRLPLNKVVAVHKIGKTSVRLEQVLGRDPTPEEISQELDMTEGEARDTLKISSKHVSLDSPMGADHSDNSLLDVLEDQLAPSPEEEMVRNELCFAIRKALHTLHPREASVLVRYFGIGRSHSMTLEEIGAELGLTSERARQIKEKGIRRLQHASRSHELRKFRQ